MTLFVRVPLGIAIMIAGYFIVAKSEVVFGWFGTNDFAEKYLGFGGTRLFYKLIGILVVFVGIFVATDVISDVLGSLAGVLTHSKPAVT